MRNNLPNEGHWKRLCPTLTLLLSIVAGAAGASPLPLAVPDFTFSDTSGEARDQRAEHEVRLLALAEHLRSELVASGKFRIVDIPCDPRPCAVDVSQNLEQARTAGARFLLLVAVHKTSTLILSSAVQVIDAASAKVVLGRFHSFRGDTDEAWQRAARFLARELIAELADKQ